MWNDLKGFSRGVAKFSTFCFFMLIFYCSLKYYELYGKICVGIMKTCTNNPNYLENSRMIIFVLLFIMMIMFCSPSKK